MRVSGSGIPSGHLETIFANFAQANSSTARRHIDSGLGLAILRRLAELMASTVWAESKPGGASAFHFTAHFEPSEAAPPVGEAASPRDARTLSTSIERSLRILLTDDSDDNRVLIKAFLNRMPFTIDEAENGSVALARFIAGNYDLVLMDLHMPVMDGLSAIRAMRAHEAECQLPRTPIIALTASALDEDIHKSFVAGADAHVSKPIGKAALLEGRTQGHERTLITASAACGCGPDFRRWHFSLRRNHDRPFQPIATVSSKLSDPPLPGRRGLSCSPLRTESACDRAMRPREWRRMLESG